MPRLGWDTRAVPGEDASGILHFEVAEHAQEMSRTLIGLKDTLGTRVGPEGPRQVGGDCARMQADDDVGEEPSRGSDQAAYPIFGKRFIV